MYQARKITGEPIDGGYRATQGHCQSDGAARASAQSLAICRMSPFDRQRVLALLRKGSASALALSFQLGLRETEVKALLMALKDASVVEVGPTGLFSIAAPSGSRNRRSPLERELGYLPLSLVGGTVAHYAD